MKLCLIGYGIIGSAWAKHYTADGHELRIWNRTRKNIDHFEPNISKAIDGVDVIHIVISDPPAVDSVLAKIETGLKKGVLVIQSSTISPEWSQKNRERVEQKGAVYVEAPFTGSKMGAENRELVFYMGGSTEGKKRAIEILSHLSKKIFDLGSNEKASAMKLSMNLNISGVFQVLSESLTLARQFGIDDELYFDVLGMNASHSGVSDLKKPKVITGDYSPHFSVKHMLKDINLALSCREDLPVTNEVRDIYVQGMEKNLGDQDFSSLIELLKK